MRIVIVGYGEMFQALISGVLTTKHEVVGVFRHENVLYKPLKRFIHDVFKPSSDFNFVRNLGLYDIKAKSVNSEEFREEIKKLNADLIIVGCWSERFEMQTINAPNKACINAHPSLLPKFRGPNPYMQVLLQNEVMTGVTFHLMDVGYDSGAILHQTAVDVLKNDTGASLKLRCCDTAKREVRILLNKFPERIKNPMSQKETDATYYSHIKLKDIIIDFEQETSNEIEKKVRAFYPWYKCVIPYKNQFFEFENCKIYNKVMEKNEPAEIIKISENSLYIVCADKKVIEFVNLKIKQPCSKLLTKLYFKKVIKTETKAV